MTRYTFRIPNLTEALLEVDKQPHTDGPEPQGPPAPNPRPIRICCEGMADAVSGRYDTEVVRDQATSEVLLCTSDSYGWCRIQFCPWCGTKLDV